MRPGITYVFEATTEERRLVEQARVRNVAVEAGDMGAFTRLP